MRPNNLGYSVFGGFATPQAEVPIPQAVATYSPLLSPKVLACTYLVRTGPSGVRAGEAAGMGLEPSLGYGRRGSLQWLPAMASSQGDVRPSPRHTDGAAAAKTYNMRPGTNSDDEVKRFLAVRAPPPHQV